MRVTQIRLVDRMFLIGAPGIGKTEVVRQLAEKEAKKKDKQFVDLREADGKTLDAILEDPDKFYVYYRIIAPHIFPEDLGIPRANGSHGKEYVEFLPPKVLKVLSMDNIEGVLFIDELTNVQRDDQLSMLYSLILEKEASWLLKLSRNIKIISAGNPAEWSEITRPLPKPLRNRMTIVEVEPPTPDEWREYMEKRYGDAWERLTYAHLKTFPQDFIKPPDDDDTTAFPTPRSWTNLAVLLYQNADAPDEFKEELVIGNVGKEAGTRFLALIRTKIDVVGLLNQVKDNPQVFDSLNTTQSILLLNAVAQLDVNEILKNYMKFIEHLAKNNRESFILLAMLMRHGNREKFIKAFSKLMIKLNLPSDVTKYLSWG